MTEPKNIAMESLYKQVLESAPIEYVMVDANLTVKKCNLSRVFPGDQASANGLHLEQVLPQGLLQRHGLPALVGTCIQSQTENKLENVRLYSHAQNAEVGYDFVIRPVQGAGGPLVALYFLDNSKNEELEFQLEILQELGFFMVGTLDMERLLFLILTGITAGPALGFNRACILLVDEKGQYLQGALGVGPTTHEEAGHIWSRLTTEKQTLRDFLSEFEVIEDKSLLPMTQLAIKLSCSMDDKDNLLVRTIEEKRLFHFKNTNLREEIHPEFFRNYHNIEFITVPLYAGDEALGVIIADNRFNWQPIRDKQKKRVELFAQLAGLTIQNANRLKRLTDNLEETRRAYESLDQANRQISSMQQHATVGQMAGFVAHEIRNPLTTIGGFARSTLKNLDNMEKVKRNARIIMEEVSRLEELLTEVLDYLRKPDPEAAENNINQVVRETCEFMWKTPNAGRVHIYHHLDKRIPNFLFDRKMIRQAIINVIKNAVSFSPPDKTVEVETRLEGSFSEISVHDYGPGISKEHRDRLFAPFFTTKDSGTGLGLTITKRIMDGHRGQITFDSQEGNGTTVTLKLPIQ